MRNDLFLLLVLLSSFPFSKSLLDMWCPCVKSTRSHISNDNFEKWENGRRTGGGCLVVALVWLKRHFRKKKIKQNVLEN
jgi:hypothetical protein